jgi:hypothetical protein
VLGLRLGNVAVWEGMSRYKRGSGKERDEVDETYRVENESR